MITKNISAVPLEQALPLIFSVLPLQFDPLENKAVYAALFHVYRSQPQALTPHIEQLLKASAYVLLDPSHEDDTTDETKTELRALVDDLRQHVPQQFAAAGFQ
jgi:hypothetical protein